MRSLIVRGDIDIYRGSSALAFSATLSFFDAMSAQPRAERRENFAEAQVPYAKLMGCAKFGAVRAASCREISCGAVRWSEIKPAKRKIAPTDVVNRPLIIH